MLKKLFKYENKALSKWLLPLSIAVIILSILASILLKTQIIFNDSLDYDIFSDLFNVSTSILLIVCIVAIVSTALIALVLILQRFRRNLFSNEGYLTFTLPVKPRDILLSKLFSASLWFLIVLISVTIGAFIFAVFGTSKEFINYDVLNFISEVFDFLYQDGELASFTTAFLIEYLIYMLISIPTGILLFYLSITLGNQIAKKHKVFAAIGMFFAISAVFSMIQSLFETIFLYIPFSGGYIEDYNFFSYLLFIPMIIVSIGAGIGFYFIIKYIIKNHLNLE